MPKEDEQSGVQPYGLYDEVKLVVKSIDIGIYNLGLTP